MGTDMLPNVITYTQLCFIACGLIIGPFFGIWAMAACPAGKINWLAKWGLGASAAWAGWFVSGVIAMIQFPNYPVYPSETTAVLFTVPGIITGLFGIFNLELASWLSMDKYDQGSEWYKRHGWYFVAFLFLITIMYYLAYKFAPPSTGMDMLGGIVIVVLGILASPVLVVGYFARKAYLSGDRLKCVFLSVIAILYIGVPSFYLRLLPGTESYFERQNMQNLTGLAFNTDKLLAEYETERSFNGDGYSAFVYTLDKDTRLKFINPAKSFRNYPIKRSARRDWTLVRWKTGLVKDSEKIYIEFAMSRASDNIHALVAKALAKPSTHYAYIHNSSVGPRGGGNKVYDIDLFIVDPVEGLLFIINHNT